jgi:anti-anti-sigma regulatory factor
MSQNTIQELSAPVLPVLPGVLVTPMVGSLDSARATMLTENILANVERLHAQYVIIDVTGVPIIDTQVAQVMLRTATAVQLLWAQVWLVGVRPEVAQTMVALNISLGPRTTHPDLQQAIAALLERNGWSHTALRAVSLDRSSWRFSVVRRAT